MVFLKKRFVMLIACGLLAPAAPVFGAAEGAPVAQEQEMTPERYNEIVNEFTILVFNLPRGEVNLDELLALAREIDEHFDNFGDPRNEDHQEARRFAQLIIARADSVTVRMWAAWSNMSWQGRGLLGVGAVASVWAAKKFGGRVIRRAYDNAKEHPVATAAAAVTGVIAYRNRARVRRGVMALSTYLRGTEDHSASEEDA